MSAAVITLATTSSVHLDHSIMLCCLSCKEGGYELSAGIPVANNNNNNNNIKCLPIPHTRMHIVKRDRMPEHISFNKITQHLELLCDITPKLNINIIPLTKAVIASLYNSIHTSELNHLPGALALGHLQVP
jgi:hypothetical protein